MVPVTARANGRVVWVADRDLEVFTDFINRVIVDRNRDHFARLARSKGQRPTVRRVVLARCRCPIARRKVNRRRLRRVPYFGHREGHCARRFVYQHVTANVEDRTVIIRRYARRQGAAIIHNGRYLAAVANRCIGRSTPVEH